MAFPSLSIGDLTAKMPIVQGGMGVGISLSGLASAVANQGGIGVIAGAMIGMKEPDVAKNPIEANLRALRQELTKAREKTQGIIGVNIMVALTTFSQMVRTAIENRADIIFSGAGLPLEMPKHLLQACEERVQDQAGPHRLFRPRGDPDRPQVALPLRLPARRLRGGRPQGRRPPRLQA